MCNNVYADSSSGDSYREWDGGGSKGGGGGERGVVQSAGDYDVWRPIIRGRAVCQGSLGREIQGKVLDVLLGPYS